MSHENRPADIKSAPATTQIERQAVVPILSAGRRWDQIAAELFEEYSRSRLQEWIKNGCLRVDNAVIVQPKQKLLGGEQLQLSVKLEAVGADQPENIPLDILYSDEHLLIVNKPAELVVHPGAGNPDGTLVNALLNWDAQLKLLPRAGIVHRLDKDTSGALLIARNIETHQLLVKAMQAREVGREYEALVFGEVVAGATIDQPIGRHRAERIKMAVVENGRPSVTHYTVRQRFAGISLLDVKLETGRTHQIRVHFSHAGYPIVGDPLYGGQGRLPKGASAEVRLALQGFRRQALHARKLSLVHPVTGETMQVHAERPEDFTLLLKLLGDTNSREAPASELIRGRDSQD